MDAMQGVNNAHPGRKTLASLTGPSPGRRLGTYQQGRNPRCGARTMADFPLDMERPGPRLFAAVTYRLSRDRNGPREPASDVRCCRRRWLLALGSLALSFAGLEAAHAASPIYKCLDNHLGLVYTDVPCKEGEKLDIRLGDVDVAAVAKLERLRDQLDESALQRISDERRAAAQFAYAQQLRRETEDRGAAEQYVSAYDGYFGYGSGANSPFDGRRLPRERMNKHEHARGFAPSPPYIVPRR
jgi:hypothetical protein